MRVLQISWKSNHPSTTGVTLFSEIYRIEEAPGPMLTGIELFQHRVSGNPGNQRVFFEIRNIERFPGSPFSDHFWRLFFEKIYIGLFLAKNQVSKNRIYMRQILRRRRNILRLTYDLNRRPRAAVLEDKPAQPLPCGSYLVVILRVRHRLGPQPLDILRDF